MKPRGPRGQATFWALSEKRESVVELSHPLDYEVNGLLLALVKLDKFCVNKRLALAKPGLPRGPAPPPHLVVNYFAA